MRIGLIIGKIRIIVEVCKPVFEPHRAGAAGHGAGAQASSAAGTRLLLPAAGGRGVPAQPRRRAQRHQARQPAAVSGGRAKAVRLRRGRGAAAVPPRRRVLLQPGLARLPASGGRRLRWPLLGLQAGRLELRSDAVLLRGGTTSFPRRLCVRRDDEHRALRSLRARGAGRVAARTVAGHVGARAGASLGAGPCAKPRLGGGAAARLRASLATAVSVGRLPALKQPRRLT